MPKKKTVALTPAIKEAALLLRYHKKKPQQTDTTFMSQPAIASHLGLTLNQVRYIIKRVLLHKKRKPKAQDASRLIEAEQAAFLKDPETLKAWAGRSLAERAVLYHRRFVHKTISAMELCRFYKRNKISRKAVNRYKAATPERLAEYAVW